jgi:hypothetical protein
MPKILNFYLKSDFDRLFSSSCQRQCELLQFIWPSGFRGEDLKKWANRKQELPVADMFVNGSEQN